jgi:hypothetical protein
VVKVGQRDEARQKVTVDDGSALLREGQSKMKYQKISGALMGATMDLVTSKALVTGQEEEEENSWGCDSVLRWSFSHWD